MKKPERIEKLKDQGGKLGGMTSYEILVDNFTGVQYLYLCNSGNGSVAVTPLVDKDGKPLLTAEAQAGEWFGKLPDQQ